MINLIIVFAWFIVIALIDLFTTRMGRRCCDNGRVPDDVRGIAFNACTWDMFKVGYPVLFAIGYLFGGIFFACLSALVAGLLHYVGWEDLMFYILEPLFPQPHRDELWRYDVKFLIWRCKSKLSYLGKGGWNDKLLMWFCGDDVDLRYFLVFNIEVLLLVILLICL